MKKFKIAAVQMSSRCGDVSGNLAEAERLVRRAARQGAKFVILPELFDTGYDLKWLKKNARRTALVTFCRLKKLSRVHGIYIIGIFANVRRGGLYNSAFMFGPSGLISRYDKNFLFRARPQEEHKYFTEGRSVRVAKTPFGRVGFAICNDIRYPALFGRQAFKGAKIIFVSAAFSRKRLDHWNTLLRARAYENQIYIVAANQVGRVGAVRFCGHSQVISPAGELLGCRKGGTGVVMATADFRTLERVRRGLPTFLGAKIR